MPRAAGRESERAELRRPHSCATCTICSEKNFLEKALTISGVDRFTRRGGTCRLHAMFMNQLCVIWGYQEELSSTAGRAETNSPRAYVVRSTSVSGPSGGRADGLLGAKAQDRTRADAAIAVCRSQTYSITSSAATSRPGGIVKPSARTVFKLTTVSYLVGACTGRSAAFSPRRIRST